jgi:hypothetical protein
VQETWESRYEQLMEQFAGDMRLYMSMVRVSRVAWLLCACVCVCVRVCARVEERRPAGDAEQCGVCPHVDADMHARVRACVRRCAACD